MSQWEKSWRRLSEGNCQYSELVMLLQRFSFVKMRQRGSHEAWRHPRAEIITLAVHSKEVPKWLQKQIYQKILKSGLNNTI